MERWKAKMCAHRAKQQGGRKAALSWCNFSLIVVILLSPSLARAGNADSFYLSGESAMLGGAIVASSSDGGSIWYNPAGLAELSGSRLDVNVSGYAISFGATVNFDSTIADAEETRLSLLDINVVPAALSYTRRIGPVGVGFGIFVPSQSVISLRTHLETPQNDAGSSLEFGYDSKLRVQEYHLGPAIGWQVSEALNLGSSLLVNYKTHYESIDVAASLDTPDGAHAQAKHTTLDSIGLGLEMVFGAQLQLSPAWRLGAVVRTPAMRIAHAVDRVETSLVTYSNGETDESIVFEGDLGLKTQMLTPFRFHLGLFREFESLQGSVEGSLMLPFDNDLAGVEQRLTWNVRAGLRGEVASGWGLGGGLYTDRSAASDPVNFQERQLNYYGMTVALDWWKSYGTFAKDEKVLEEPGQLNFGTTVAFSYAIGIGELASARVGPGESGELEMTSITADVVSHEFTFHISTSISE